MRRKQVVFQQLIEGQIADVMPQSIVSNIIYSADGAPVMLSTILAQILASVDSLGTLATKNEVSYTDLALSLQDAINNKADRSDTLAGYGITDAYTKSQIDGLISGAFHFRGQVDYYSDLPADAKDGDVWQVQYSGTSGTDLLMAEYVWSATQGWVEFGTGGADLSAYAKTDDVNAALASKVDKAEGKGLSSNDFTTEYMNRLDNAVLGTRTVAGMPLSADVTMIGIGYGGTGATTADGARANLGASKVYYGPTTPVDLQPNDLFVQLVD